MSYENGWSVSQENPLVPPSYHKQNNRGAQKSFPPQVSNTCRTSVENINPNPGEQLNFTPLECKAGSNQSNPMLGSFCSDFHQWNDPLIINMTPNETTAIYMGGNYDETCSDKDLGGACCSTENSTCTDVADAEECADLGGDYQGSGTSCDAEGICEYDFEGGKCWFFGGHDGYVEHETYSDFSTLTGFYHGYPSLTIAEDGRPVHLSGGPGGTENPYAFEKTIGELSWFDIGCWDSDMGATKELCEQYFNFTNANLESQEVVGLWLTDQEFYDKRKSTLMAVHNLEEPEAERRAMLDLTGYPAPPLPYGVDANNIEFHGLPPGNRCFDGNPRNSQGGSLAHVQSQGMYRIWAQKSDMARFFLSSGIPENLVTIPPALRPNYGDAANMKELWDLCQEEGGDKNLPHFGLVGIDGFTNRYNDQILPYNKPYCSKYIDYLSRLSYSGQEFRDYDYLDEGLPNYLYGSEGSYRSFRFTTCEREGGFWVNCHVCPAVNCDDPPPGVPRECCENAQYFSFPWKKSGAEIVHAPTNPMMVPWAITSHDVHECDGEDCGHYGTCHMDVTRDHLKWNMDNRVTDEGLLQRGPGLYESYYADIYNLGSPGGVDASPYNLTQIRLWYLFAGFGFAHIIDGFLFGSDQPEYQYDDQTWINFLNTYIEQSCDEWAQYYGPVHPNNICVKFCPYAAAGSPPGSFRNLRFLDPWNIYGGNNGWYSWFPGCENLTFFGGVFGDAGWGWSPGFNTAEEVEEWYETIYDMHDCLRTGGIYETTSCNNMGGLDCGIGGWGWWSHYWDYAWGLVAPWELDSTSNGYAYKRSKTGYFPYDGQGNLDETGTGTSTNRMGSCYLADGRCMMTTEWMCNNHIERTVGLEERGWEPLSNYSQNSDNIPSACPPYIP